MSDKMRTYQAEGIEISFNAKRCIHAEFCIKGLPAVFEKDRRPWIVAENAPADAIAEVVGRCPTGALHYQRLDGGQNEVPDATNSIQVQADGPLHVRGDIHLLTAGGETLLEDVRVALCRCGASQNKPFCDNSHLESGFHDAGQIKGRLEAENTGGQLSITATQDGPFVFAGSVEMKDAAGAAAHRVMEGALCRCGHSANKPFCDGTHRQVGFKG